MLISSDLEMSGSISGGCVEGTVLKEAQRVFETGEGKRLVYGVSDDDAWAVGLSCGGKMQAYIQPFTDAWSMELAACLANNQGCVLVTKLADGKPFNELIPDDSSSVFADTIVSQAREAYKKRVHRTIAEDGAEYFIHIFPPRGQVIMIGAAHITADLIQLAHTFDFETMVIDPRRAFAQQTSFPVPPDKIYEAYPSEVLHEIRLDPYTYVVILSHDPKIDDDALKVLLRSDVAYIGALGSRKNHEKRINRLKAHGFSEAEISRIDAPIGIDIRAQGAREIALSIMGAIIKAKNEFR